MNQTIFLLTQGNLCPLQNLQESKLKLFRLHRIYLIKRMYEAFIILFRKSGNEVQMHMNIVTCPNPFYNLRQMCHICTPVNCLKRFRIRSLHSNFQLDQSWTHLLKQFQFLFRNQFSRYLKVKISDIIVMFCQILPDCHGMRPVAIKGTVDEFYLRHLTIEEKL